MTATLVDSNVLIDVATLDPVWQGWSEAALARAAEEGALIVNPIVYAEVSARYDTPDQVEAAIPARIFRREHLPWDAAFVAGKAFVLHRRRGGAARAPLPDFHIGAHAAVARYRPYFPTVELIAPDS